MDGKNITFHYFPINGKGSLIRCMLVTAGIKFTDHCISMEEWGSMEKPTEVFEYGQLPILEVDGKYYSQCMAIEMMVGKKLGFLGCNAWECYEICNVVCAREDIFALCAPIFALFIQENKDNLEKNMEIVKEKLPKFLTIFCNKIKCKTGKYLCGDNLSIADMFFCHLFTVLSHPCRSEHLKECLMTNGAEFCAYAEGLCKNELKKFFCDGVEGGWNCESPL